MNPATPPSAADLSAEDALIIEAVQLLEARGPLDDAAAARAAAALPHGTPAQRLAHRARLLGERIGLVEEIHRMRAWAPWMLLGLVLAIVLGGLALAGNVVGGETRHINVVVALTSLLGLHLLTLVLWLLGLLWPLRAPRASFGWLWLALTARVAGGRHGQGPLLLRAATRLLARARLLPWLLGLASHAIWSLSFLVVLAALLFSLAFRSYTLSWETTILDPEFFVAAVQALGRVPGWLGFPVPSAQTVLAPAADGAGQRAWAGWLTGCIAVYGALPRLLLAALCAAVWRARRGRMQPALAQPELQRVAARIAALAPRHIVDADPGAPRPGGLRPLAPGETSAARMLVGFELPDDAPWPPAALASAGDEALRVDGSAAQQRALLDRLMARPPAQVLVGCRADASPDRGTERFLRAVANQSGACQVRLAGPQADHPSAVARWQGWLHERGLADLADPAWPAAEPAP